MAVKKDEKGTYDEMLQKHIDRKDFVKVFRSFKGISETLPGFILSVSKQFLLLQLDGDFLFDGYAIICKDHFDNVQCSKYEKALKKIYKAEGLLNSNEYGLDKEIALSDWQQVFKGLRKFDYHVIVECENKDQPDFVIGPIKRITQNSVSIQYYDPAGQLEEGTTTVRYDDITIVKFGDRYSTTFRKYLNQPNH